ncbi:MAG: hypothetical protein KDI79_07055 [Anaerolineae bacterium]|nr:hypothetical protein [Anaerolineae bacterium]
MTQFTPLYLLKYIALTMLFLLAACQTAGPASLPQWQWTRAENGLPRQASIVLAAAVNPINPDQFWAGYYSAGGLLTSQDGGQTWTVNGAGLADNPIFDVLPSAPIGQEKGAIKLWAAARDGLLASSDGGQSWQSTPGLPAATAFALATDAEARLYAGFDGAGVYAETEDGTWRSIVPEDSPLASAAVISLAVSDNGQYLYAGTSGQGIFASRDSGQSWQAAYEGKYGSNMAINPTNPHSAIASLRDQVVRTQDGGQSWQRVASLPLKFDEATSFLWLADGALIAGTSQGRLYRSPDGGTTWSQGGDGLPAGGVLDLAGVERSGDAHRLLAATWNGLYGSDDLGETWHNLAPDLGTVNAHALLTLEDGLLLGTGAGLFRWQVDDQRWQSATDVIRSGGIQSLTVDPTDSQRIYAGSSGDGMIASHDGGVTWQSVSGTGVGIPALAVAPLDSDHLYKLAAWERVYESYDGGATWLARWDGLGDVLETVSLAVDPTGNFIYVGTEDGLFRAKGSERWDLTARSLSGQSILALLAHATANGSTLIIGTTRGIYRSLDHGDTVEGPLDTSPAVGWGRGLEHISVTALLADPHRPEILYAGTAYHGVYQSNDGGQSWLAIGPANLTDTVIEALAWGPNNTLFIAAANGVWQGTTP